LEYGRTTYIYHIGAGLIAGANIDNYRVYLQCSNDNSCTDGMCDCFYRGQEERYKIPSGSGSLSAGEMFNEEFFEKVIDSPVRYDKAVIEWDWTDNTGKKQTTSKVQDIEEAGERTPDDCKLDSGSGEFRCKYIIGKEGFARFVDIDAIDSLEKRDVVYGLGNIINFDVEVEVKRPDSNYVIPKYFTWKLTDGNGNEIAKMNNPFRIPITDSNWKTKEPKFEIENVFGKETEAYMDLNEPGDGYETLQMNEKLIGNPTEDLLFAIVFSKENYKRYSVKEENSKLELDKPKEILTAQKGKEYDTLKYRGAEFEITRPTDPDKERVYGRIISIDAGGKIQECDKDGKAYWNIKFELLNSKLKKDKEGEEDKLGSYECCGKSIETEEFDITIDCGEEYGSVTDETEQCDTNILIRSDKTCTCKGKILNDKADFGFGESGYVICCKTDTGEEKVGIFYYKEGLNELNKKDNDIITKEKIEELGKDGYLLDEDKVNEESYIEELCSK